MPSTTTQPLRLSFRARENAPRTPRIDVMSSPGYLVVLLPGPVYLCVPRRAFETDGDFERFGQTVADLAAAGGGLTGRAPSAGEARGT